MKSNSFRTLVDYDGKQYIFNSEMFSSIVSDKCGIIQVGKKAKRLTTQSSIMTNIAEKVGVTFDAVKHWKQGDNGPGDIIMVKDIADVLNVSYKELLIPLFNSSEEYNMSDYEKNVISNVYGECISILYNHIEWWFTGEDGPFNKEYKQWEECKNNKEKEIIKRINQLHLMIDKSSVLIRDDFRYKLHRILIEYEESLFDMLPSRWEELQIYKREENAVWMRVSTYLIDKFYDCESREDAISKIFPLYINEEISLAERLGYYDNKAIPDDVKEKYEDIDELQEKGITKKELWELYDYGFKNPNRNAVFEFEPKIIVIDLMIQVISTVFKNDFPDLKAKE